MCSHLIHSKKKKKAKSLLFSKQKPKEPLKKVVIGTPSNFQHIVGQSNHGVLNQSGKKLFSFLMCQKKMKMKMKMKMKKKGPELKRESSSGKVAISTPISSTENAKQSLSFFFFSLAINFF